MQLYFCYLYTMHQSCNGIAVHSYFRALSCGYVYVHIRRQLQVILSSVIRLMTIRDPGMRVVNHAYNNATSINSHPAVYMQPCCLYTIILYSHEKTLHVVIQQDFNFTCNLCLLCLIDFQKFQQAINNIVEILVYIINSILFIACQNFWKSVLLSFYFYNESPVIVNIILVTQLCL